MSALPPVSANSWSIAKRHWPHFIFAWVWPLLLYAAMIFLSSRGPDADRFLWGCTVVLLITFLGFGYFAALPYWRGQIRLGQALLWLVVVPTIVLLLLSLSPFRFPITLTNPTSSSNRFERSRGGVFGEPRRESMIGIKQLRLSSSQAPRRSTSSLEPRSQL
jgi:hypothetical protein